MMESSAGDKASFCMLSHDWKINNLTIFQCIIKQLVQSKQI